MHQKRRTNEQRKSMKTSGSSRNEKIEMKCKKRVVPSDSSPETRHCPPIVASLTDISALVRARVSADVGCGSYAEVEHILVVCVLHFCF